MSRSNPSLAKKNVKSKNALEQTAPLMDVTLIDEMLRLSPEERLLLNDRLARTIMELRDAFQSK